MQRSANMTPRMMILGLVVQEPGTLADIGRRFADQFAAAGFPRNSAHTNLPSLAREGHLRLVKRGPVEVYESTPEGVTHLHEWLRRSSLPAIRDVVQGKLEFVELEDLPAMLKTVRQDREDCRNKCALAHGELLTHKRLLRRLPKEAADWRDRLCLIRLEDRAKMWGGQVERLESLGKEIERLLMHATHGEA